MKIILIILSLLAFNVGYTQNPLGLYVDIDGEIKFWDSEANLNGNLDDTVIVRIGSKSYFEDLRNLKQIDLTFIEAPRDRETMETNLDPSNINDTIPSVWGSHLGDTNFFDWNINLASAIIDSSYQTNTLESKYSDIVRGDGLTDSVLQNVKTRLENYIDQYYGKYEPYEAYNKLYLELSNYDSIVDKVAIYDYLVDRVVFYDYNDNNQLIRVIGYQWNGGVEVDYLKYDNIGNLIYFSRENIGSSRNEFFFTYDNNNRVFEVENLSSTARNTDETSFVNPDIRKVKFTYDKAGMVNSKSTLQDDGNWLTCYYEIK